MARGLLDIGRTVVLLVIDSRDMLSDELSELKECDVAVDTEFKL